MDDEALDARPPAATGGADVVVVVPVYDDARATRRCFDALLADSTRLKRRIVVVDDASPNPMIRAHLDRLAQAGRIELIRNPHNIGFIRSVNRALLRVGSEDVVLLNADTHVPRGWLERLRAVAQAPGVGTVTPLSNNGELVSVPGRFRSSPMPSTERILAIDAAAQALDAPPVLMPNGVGFCLYIRNAALRAVGGLDAGRYERGYLEEVDFCLRVAEAGFQNVCAPNVFVGHQGEASFGASKRSLVTANATALMRRWPDIEPETTAFVRDDPLRDIAADLAWVTLAPGSRRIAVTAGRPIDPGVRSRLAADDPRELVLISGIARDPQAWTLRLPHMDGSVSVPADLAAAAPEAALAGLAARVGAADAVVCLEEELDAAWTGLVVSAGLTLDLFMVDAALLDPAKLLASALARRVLAPSQAVADRLAAAGLAGETLPRPAPPRLAHPPALPEEADHAGAIGIVPPDASPASYAFIRDLARAMLRRRSARSLVVLGGTMRDIGIMRLGNTFVTGPIAGEDPASVLAIHRCSGLLLAQRDGSFVSAALDFVAASGLPFAAFDIGGAGDLLRQRPGDGMPLDLAWDVDKVAFLLDMALGRPGGVCPQPLTRLARTS